MNTSKRLLQADTVLKNDLADIMAIHNKKIGDCTYFRNLLYRAVASQTLIPLPNIIDLSVEPEERNFEFMTKTAIQWAANKNIKLPLSKKQSDTQDKTSKYSTPLQLK